MLQVIVEKTKGLLLSPVGTFQKSRGDTVEQTLSYFVVIVFIHAVLSAFIAFAVMATGTIAVFRTMVQQMGWASPVLGIVGVVTDVIVMEILAVVLVFIIGGWLHLWVYLFGGRKGYMQTVKALALGSTPWMLVGWIPFVGFIGFLWSVVLWVFGVRELQETSTDRAAGAVLLSIIIVAIIALLLAAVFFIAMLSSMPEMTGMRMH
jgi:hypothetical protein